MSEVELSLDDARSLIDSGAVDQTIGSEDGSAFTESTVRERDESGRFASSNGEQKFGLEGLEQDAGYVPLADLRKDKETKSYSGDNAVEKALGDLEKSGALSPEPEREAVQWFKTDGSGEPLEPNVTATLDQSADALSTYEGNLARYVDGMEIDAVRDLIDNSRAELLKSDPKAAELYGLDPKEVEANAPKETADAPAPEATKQAQPSTEIEGSDEELTRALKHPKIADAVASEWTKAETARQQYAHGLNLANQLAQQGVVDRLPELANLPIGQWGDAIITLAQQDPARVQQALAPLERAAKLQAVQNEWNQHQAAQQQAQRWQQIENHVKAEDARLVEMVGGQKAADQANQAMVDYLTERGVAKNQMVNVIAQNPVLRTAEARQTIWKAQQYDRLMAAPKAVPTTPKQHVLKPGNGAGKTGREISLGALEARFNRSASLDDAFALYSARNR